MNDRQQSPVYHLGFLISSVVLTYTCVWLLHSPDAPAISPPATMLAVLFGAVGGIGIFAHVVELTSALTEAPDNV